MPKPNGQKTTKQLKQLLTELIQKEPWVMDVLKAARKLELPDWCIAGGVVRGAVWDH